MPSYQVNGDPVLKDKKAPPVEISYTTDELAEKDEVQLMLDTKENYHKSRQAKEKEWTESYKMYMSYIDTTRNPFLSNLFIPKTHEAVELLAAFLIGTNQSINTAPENNGDDYKATVAGKWLDFIWRKVIKARIKVLTWIKQGIIFGNGFVKVGWDSDNNVPWLVNTAIEDVYVDYYEPDIQDSEWIFHEIRRSIEDVKSDDKYNEKIRADVIIGKPNPYDSSIEYKFAAYDKSLVADVCQDKVPILEGWCKSQNKLISIAPTSEGWRILRKIDNPCYYPDGEGKQIPFRPFVKLRFKSSPLANRSYDTGAIFPTIKIQKAFNDLMNQYFDNVVIINNPMWKKRRGARINPMELVRRPGGVITMSDINNDLVSETISDVKQSIIEMLNRLDAEFQQASMVVNLLKGVDNGASNTATEVQLGQQNVQTLLDMIDENIGESLSELGDMILSLSLANAEGNHTIKMFENDTHTGVLEFDPKNIIGRYDIKISADRTAGTSKVVRQKQLLDFISLILKNPGIGQTYPNLMKKTLEKWLEEAGFSDTEFFFDEGTGQFQATPSGQPGGLPGAGSGMPGMDKLLTEAANLKSGGSQPIA